MKTIQHRRLEPQDPIYEHSGSRSILEESREPNRLLPWVALPTELLIKIFSHLIHSRTDTTHAAHCSTLRCYSETAPESGHGPRYGWLRASYVCHRWREVMLGTPQLWAIVWITSPECVREMLSRSQQVPLVIKFRQSESRVEPSKYLQSLSIALNQLSRVAILDLANGDGPIMVRERPWVTPLMKELVVRRGFRFFSRSMLGTPLHVGLLANEMPLLEKLELHTGLIWWSANLVKPTLRYLTLHGTVNNRPVVIDAVLGVLSQLPALETVDLQLALPPSSSGSPDAGTPFAFLPNLRKLRVIDSAKATSELLAQLSFPGDTQISFACTYHAPSEVFGLLGAIRSHLGNPYPINSKTSSSSVRSAVLYGQNANNLMAINLKLECWPMYHPLDQLQRATVEKDETAQLAMSEPLVSLKLDNHDPSHLPVLRLLNAIPTEAVESLYLDPPSADDTSTHTEADTLTSLLMKTPELRELGVGAFAVHCILQVLHYRTFHEDKAANVTESVSPMIQEQLILPRLSVLFLNRRDKSTYPHHRIHHNQFIRQLVQLLKVRKDVSGGRKLERLVVEGCSDVIEDAREAFSNYVNAVHTGITHDV
ncbi:hypothetical protein BC629DRAFT_1739460 [Irpex lacteus]|nr:hypothetical protein BC629DRAFT_1739460 [Irpex lacteus]